MLKEFREFAMRGNVLDMAIGLMLGSSFGKIVNSLVEDMIMPPLTLFLGKMDLSNLFINLTGDNNISLEHAKTAGDITINYGKFINQIVDFIVVAFAIYLVVKQINRFKRDSTDYIDTLKTKTCPFCFKIIPHKAKRCPYCTTELDNEI